MFGTQQQVRVQEKQDSSASAGSALCRAQAEAFSVFGTQQQVRLKEARTVVRQQAQHPAEPRLEPSVCLVPSSRCTSRRPGQWCVSRLSTLQSPGWSLQCFWYPAASEPQGEQGSAVLDCSAVHRQTCLGPGVASSK